MKQVNSKVIKCVSLNMENKKELNGTSYMIVLFIRLFLAKMWSLMKNPCSKCENTIKKTKGAKVKVLFQGLHMACVIFVLVYNLKVCILNTQFNIAC
jgi:hypothetical protein